MTRTVPATGALVLLMLPAAADAANPYFPQAGACEWPESVTFPVWSGTVTDPDGTEHDEERAGCGGTWLGQGWFATAGHCVDPQWTHGERLMRMRFGNHTDSGSLWEGEVDWCAVHPDGAWTADDYWYGPDVAVCRIAGDAWPNVPAVPILVPGSCENDYIRNLAFSSAGSHSPSSYPWSPYGYGMAPVEIEVAGHGTEEIFADNGDDCALYYGECHLGNTRIVRSYLFSESAYQGGRAVPFVARAEEAGGVNFVAALDRWNDWPSDASIEDHGILNHGDSGSPMYFEMEDGTWRVIGVASLLIRNLYKTAPDADDEFYNNVRFASLPTYLPWIEWAIDHHEPGVDITPCHTRVGNTYTYSWTTACQAAVAAYPTNPDDNGVAWSDGCALSAGGSTSRLRRECAGWMPGLPEAAPEAPSHGDDELGFALNGVVVEPEDLLFELPAGNPTYGTGEGDVVYVTPTTARSLVSVGDGADSVVIRGGSRGNAQVQVFAGTGDDSVTSTSDAPSLVFPGTGRDTVTLGAGDDTLVVMGGCELVAGETWDGGAGTDTLVSPLSVCDLALRGIFATGFETWRPTDPVATAAVCPADGTPPVLERPDAEQEKMIASLCDGA